MGKRGAKKLPSSQGGANLKSVLRYEHLKNLALWSSTGDTPIPSIGSLFGRSFAADSEANGININPDLISCQRCETILQPGFNCNVRIEKASNKKKHKRFNISSPKNNVVYNCNFCSHRNLKRGTSKGHMKEIYPSKPKAPSKIKKGMVKMMVAEETLSSMCFSSPERSVKDEVEENCVVDTPKPMMLTLERDKRIRKSKSKKPIEPESVGGSNKRKRKSWTSIKEMAQTNMSSRGGLNYKIPFHL